MNNIYLIGMMGSGKSVTGRKLAEMLKRSFTDLDDLIEQRLGRTISEIFRKEGEAFFRKKESELLEEVSRQRDHVVATGGGVVLKESNISRMKSTGTLIYLEGSPETLWRRVKEKKDRPLLEGPDAREKLETLLAERELRYHRVADLRVDTDGETAEAVAQKILRNFREKL